MNNNVNEVKRCETLCYTFYCNDYGKLSILHSRFSDLNVFVRWRDHNSDLISGSRSGDGIVEVGAEVVMKAEAEAEAEVVVVVVVVVEIMQVGEKKKMVVEVETKSNLESWKWEQKWWWKRKWKQKW